uniref:Putative leucine-rich repeat protein (LRRP) n=1 Tax=Trypanosoma congolense (strain IL3000) TaxID=1068625 RepID=G0UUZ3_TRYCI|nr:putative leucine-rich repeat protein (LRRP) [Trypanosoma congolense IL3000]
MELVLSRKGIKNFDASALLQQAETSGLCDGGASQKRSCIAVHLLDLSHNSIKCFVGGQMLVGLAVLNLSNNCLGRLDATCLPTSLTHLNLARNALRSLRDLATATPRLRELDISFNSITSPNLSGLPKSLTTLLCQNNSLASVDPFANLFQLHHLDLSSNHVEDVEEFSKLRGLRSLRRLELCGNPVTREPNAMTLLLDALPRLTCLDRTPLSQASGNQMVKAQLARSRKVAHDQSTSKSVSDTSSSTITTRKTAGIDEQDIEVRRMEARVKELTRLVESAGKSEMQLRYQKKILQEQVTACAGVIDSQAAELERLEREIRELKSEEASLREPMAEADQTFVQTHASLVAHRLSNSSS